jgi:hypothetical protein
MLILMIGSTPPNSLGPTESVARRGNASRLGSAWLVRGSAARVSAHVVRLFLFDSFSRSCPAAQTQNGAYMAPQPPTPSTCGT